MAIRDSYKVRLNGGSEYVISATKQGGRVQMEDPTSKDPTAFISVVELTKGGVVVRQLRVARHSVESILYEPGK